ncbi:MAG: hypothetical protein KBE01_01695 [Synergistaceae bacterium]|nr:hypothetical protein [Synergistaceae bacterium]
MKKRRFPLDINGEKIRTLEELQKAFAPSAVMPYYLDGRLVLWLKDRHYDDIAEKIESLDKQDADFHKDFCAVLNVECVEDALEDVQALEERIRRLKLLKNHANADIYEDKIDSIAFEQEDIFDFLDDGREEIYLCGASFSIPLGKKKVTYIGINNPLVVIGSSEPVDLEEKGICIQNCQFDEKYRQVLEKINNTATKKTGKTARANGDYKPSSFLSPTINQKKSQELFGIAQKTLGQLQYDRDMDIVAKMQIMLKMDLRNAGQYFMNHL